MKYLKNITIIFILLTIFCTTTVFSTGTVTYNNTSSITTYSPSCLLMESKTGNVIYEKKGYEKMYPASTTKIMTAILTLEHCELTDVATASYEAVFTVPVRIY